MVSETETADGGGREYIAAHSIRRKALTMDYMDEIDMSLVEVKPL